jgi:hypothetical protein
MKSLRNRAEIVMKIRLFNNLPLPADALFHPVSMLSGWSSALRRQGFIYRILNTNVIVRPKY